MSAVLAAAYVWAQVVIPGKTPVQQFGINDKGQTAVTIEDGTTGIYRRGEFTPLPPPPASCGCTVGALAVNNSGVVVGIAVPTAGGPNQGFLLSNSTYTFFSRPGWDNTSPRGIGEQGLVVGWSFSNDVSQSPFGATQVPFADHFQLGGVATRARGINDFGVTVGFVNDASGRLAAFVGSDTFGYEMVVPPGGDAPNRDSFCTGINNHGQIACSVSTADTTTLFISTPKSHEDD